MSKFKGIGSKRIAILEDAGIITDEDFANVSFQKLQSLPSFGYKIAYKIFQQLGREIDYPSMREIKDNIAKDVIIENKTIKPWRVYKKGEIVDNQPVNFSCERTTVWSFETRGAWASHTPQYRGNWSPYIVRNIIELYSEPGDLVLDPMCGGGTTAVECLLTNRNSLSSDINPDAISITRDRLDLPKNCMDGLLHTDHKTYIGDVRNLNLVDDSSIDLIATHPPYANIIRYAPGVDGDLSDIGDYDCFFLEFRKAIKELYRVLKPGKMCAILVGDTHNKSHFVPISTRMMLDFLKEGFILKEDVIKKEWNCESNRYLKKYANSDFLLTMHEHLFVFEKPMKKNEFKNSSIGFFETNQ